MRGRIALVAVVALCAFNLSTFHFAANVRYRVFHIGAWNEGIDAARAKLGLRGRAELLGRSVRPRWMRAIEDEWTNRPSVDRGGVLPPSFETEFAAASIGAYDPETRVWVRVRLLDAGDWHTTMWRAAFEAGHDHFVRSALARGDIPESALGPRTPIARAEMSGAFDGATSVLDLTPLGWHRVSFLSAIATEESHRRGGRAYTLEQGGPDTGFVARWKLPIDGEARSTTSRDGRLLIVHDVDADAYWCIDLRESCVVATTVE